MLKIVTNCVLGSKQSSPYPSGYASGCFFPAALLDDHFEHPGEPKVQNAKLITTEMWNFEFLIWHCEAKA
jgi:hypothetical protein